MCVAMASDGRHDLSDGLSHIPLSCRTNVAAKSLSRSYRRDYEIAATEIVSIGSRVINDKIRTSDRHDEDNCEL